MIKGHGIDIESIAAIEKPIRRIPDSLKKVLTEAEKSALRNVWKTENGIFMGRWSAKKPFQRQWEQGLDQLVFKI